MKTLLVWGATEVVVLSFMTLSVVFAEGITLEPAYLLTILAGAGGVIALLFRLLITSKDRESALVMAEKDRVILELESVKKSYQEVAAEALRSALDTTNWYRQRDGKPPLIPAAPVISESHSPSTEKQRETAALQTMRATMAAVKLVTGQEARQEPPHAQEPAPIAPVPEDRTQQSAVQALQQAIDEVPERTAEKVVEKLDEKKDQP